MLNKVIGIAGIRRSGNHALRIWINYQAEQPVVVRNDCSFNLIEEDYYKPIKFIDEKESYDNPVPFEDLHNYRTYIVGMENPYINTIQEFVEKAKKHIEILQNRINNKISFKYIVILRNPFNLLASMLGLWDFNKEDHKKLIIKQISLWTPIAKEYLNITNYIDKDIGKIILFNEWFTNIEYRKEISNFLGLEFNDNGKNRIISVGSSFDKDKDHKAEEMDVLNRYENYENNEIYKKIIYETEDLLELSEKIFTIPDFIKR